MKVFRVCLVGEGGAQFYDVEEGSTDFVWPRDQNESVIRWSQTAEVGEFTECGVAEIFRIRDR